MKQLTEKQAIRFHDLGEWKDWTDEEIVQLQLFQDRLCIPFGRFHEAIEKVLGRPVWKHEFANPDRIIDEYQKEHQAPTLQEIMDLIPEGKRIIFLT